MISLLRKIFIDNWQRKVLAFILAMIVWMIINHSLSEQKTVSGISVKIVNLPKGKTVEGLQDNGVLNRKISLTLSGNKTILEKITGEDLQVKIDASNKKDDWIASISKKNLVSLNPDINVSQAVTKISHHDFLLRLSKLVTEKIPILLTPPIGEGPKGYQFLDAWPYQLYITVTGPEETVKRLKAKGLKLTFNLDDISQAELDSIIAKKAKEYSDEVSFPVPDTWKKISIPNLSDTSIAIDDPKAKLLRVDFIKRNLISINNPLPITVFYPSKYNKFLNPTTASLEAEGIIENRNGIPMISVPLYAKGVSRIFVETVRERIQLVVLAAPKNERSKLIWNIQFVYPHELENRFVARMINESGNENTEKIHEEYLRNRFRSYMNSFRLYTNQQQKLLIQFELKNQKIIASQSNYQSNQNVR